MTSSVTLTYLDTCNYSYICYFLLNTILNAITALNMSLLTVPMRYFFCVFLCFCSVLCLLCLCVRLFYVCFVVTYWERADLLALVCGV